MPRELKPIDPIAVMFFSMGTVACAVGGGMLLDGGAPEIAGAVIVCGGAIYARCVKAFP